MMKNIMGLDKRKKRVFNESMVLQKLFTVVDLGLRRLLGGTRKTRVSPLSREREEYEAEVKDQFKKLKDKGLSIPVFTL